MPKDLLGFPPERISPCQFKHLSTDLFVPMPPHSFSKAYKSFCFSSDFEFSVENCDAFYYARLRIAPDFYELLRMFSTKKLGKLQFDVN